MAETTTAATETVAPALTDDMLAKLGAVVGAAVKEAVAPLTAKKVKEKKEKDGKVATSESTEQSAEGKQKAGKHRSLKETVTEGELQTALAEREAQIIEKLRNQLIAEGNIPSRKGFRVTESDEGKEPDGAELWKNRKFIIGSNTPALFAGTEVGDQLAAQPTGTAA